MDTKISQHTNDILQKYASGLFRNATLEFYGIKTPKIKELINVELPVVEVGASSSDYIFLLEDDSYLHLEFESEYNKGDLIRFAHYDLRLYERDGRNITTVIIYTANVKKADASLNTGAFLYNPDKIMMADYDGNAIFLELEEKIRNDKELDDVDMLKLFFLPLMKNDVPKEELAVKSIKLAQTILDKTRRNACVAAAFAFGSKYLDEDGMKQLLEVLRMTDLAVLFKQEGMQEGMQKGMQKREVEIAKEMLKDNEPMAKIIKYTKLDESTIGELYEEMMSTTN